MRELTTNVQVAVAQPVTKPGYLLQIGFASQTVRLCTRGDVYWNGSLWLGRWFDVQNLSLDGAQSAISATIVITDAEGTLQTFVLADGIADRPISLWKVYGETPEYFDPVPFLVGSGNGADIDPDAGKVSIAATNTGGRTGFAPRRYISPAEGFNVIPPTGTILSFQKASYRLERADG